MNELIKKINQIRFEILSPEDIRKMSYVRVETPDTYDSDGYPIEGGLMDPRMGVLDPTLRCHTCGVSGGDCQGHFGSIELAKPVIHVGFADIIHKILRSTCNECGRILLDSEETFYYTEKIRDALDNKNNISDILEEVYIKSKRDIIYELEGWEIDERYCCPHCGAPQEAIELDRPTYIFQGDYKLSASEIRARLEKVSDEDAFVLGINPEVARPEWLVLTVLPVPPITVRPSETLPTGERKENDLTHKLVDILRINQRLIENMQAGAPHLIIEDLWDLLQYHVTTYFDNEASGVPPSKHRSGRPYETLLQRLKGKEGRFRSNLSGKRVNFSGRTVISPDPNIGINEVGVPEVIAKELTVPSYVTEFNIDEMKRYIDNGPYIYPGANFMITESGNRRRINDVTKEYILENIKPGDIVERHLTDGDIVLLNRYPSLHKMSIMAHEVKVHPNNTLKIHPCVTPPYNADFDGDEMNIHVLQTDESRAEAMSLMLVENNMMSPRYGGPIIGAIRDIVSGTFLLTKNDTEFFEEEALQILRKSHVEIPPFKNGNWILKYDDNSAEESFIYKKKGEKWTGKELFSLLLPNDLNLQFNSKISEISDRFNDESYVTIEEGILKNGIIDENACGAFSGHLLDKIAKEYGFKKARVFLEKLSLMSIAVFMKFGITTSLHDYEIPINAQNKINEHLSITEEKVDILIQAYCDGYLDALPGKSLEETLEIRIMQLLNEARDYAGEICEPYFDINNKNFPFPTFGRNSAAMTYTGYDTSKLNFTQISACVGQQGIRKTRIHRGYLGRTLTHFRKNDMSAKAKGFVKSSFKSGLDPIEFFFHAISGRGSMLDKSIRVSQSGYMQRRLINALLELSSDKNGLVQDNLGNVVQLVYGEDGVDPVKSDFGNPADLDRLIDEIKIKDNADETKIFNFKKNYEKLQELKKESDKLIKKLNRSVDYLPDKDDEENSHIWKYVDNLKYNKDNQENPPSLLVENDFNEILDKYECEKQKQFKTSDFILNLQDKIKIDVFKFVRSIVGNPLDSFSVRCYFGVNSWAEMPSISIINDNIYESFQEGLHINYTFDTKNSKVFLSIYPRSKSNEEFLNLKKSLIERLENINISSKFIVGDNDFDEYAVILTKYEKNDIKSSTLEKDLKELLTIYSSLSDVYDKISEDKGEIDEINDSNLKLDFNVDILDSIINNPNENSINIMNLNYNPYGFFNYGNFSKDLDEFESLFSDENLKKLKDFDFEYSSYHNVLKTIWGSFIKSFDNFLIENNLKENFYSLDITEKILIFAKSFVDVKYKSIQNELGYLSFNQIFIDDRLNNSKKITTLIHELSHYILSEILKLVVMTIFDSKKNPLIEAYIFLTLDWDLWYLLDEFCAHTVEGRFALYGYQDYGSYEYKFKEVSSKYSEEDIEYCLDIANTFAQDIKKFMESFIKDSYREEIKETFNYTNELPTSKGLNYERNTTLNSEGLMEALRVILYTGALSCTDRKSDLKKFASKFEKRRKYN